MPTSGQNQRRCRSPGCACSSSASWSPARSRARSWPASARLACNDGRVAHEAEIDAAISAWTGARARDEVLAALRAAEVACGPIQSIADIVADAQFLARGTFERVRLPDGQPVRIPAVVPRLTRTPGQTRWIAPEVGSHTLAVLRDLAGATEAELQALADGGVIATAPAAGREDASPRAH